MGIKDIIYPINLTRIREAIVGLKKDLAIANDKITVQDDKIVDLDNRVKDIEKPTTTRV